MGSTCSAPAADHAPVNDDGPEGVRCLVCRTGVLSVGPVAAVMAGPVPWERFISGRRGGDGGRCVVVGEQVELELPAVHGPQAG